MIAIPRAVTSSSGRRPRGLARDLGHPAVPCASEACVGPRPGQAPASPADLAPLPALAALKDRLLPAPGMGPAALVAGDGRRARQPSTEPAGDVALVSRRDESFAHRTKDHHALHGTSLSPLRTPTSRSGPSGPDKAYATYEAPRPRVFRNARRSQGRDKGTNAQPPGSEPVLTAVWAACRTIAMRESGTPAHGQCCGSPTSSVSPTATPVVMRPSRAGAVPIVTHGAAPHQSFRASRSRGASTGAVGSSNAVALPAPVPPRTLDQARPDHLYTRKSRDPGDTRRWRHDRDAQRGHRAVARERVRGHSSTRTPGRRSTPPSWDHTPRVCGGGDERDHAAAGRRHARHERVDRHGAGAGGAGRHAPDRRRLRADRDDHARGNRDPTRRGATCRSIRVSL